MRIAIVSETGEGVALATHLSSEGHDVGLIYSDNSHSFGDGIIPASLSADGSNDIIFYDDLRHGARADADRSRGMKVLGASRWAQAIEEDSSYADAIIKSIGWEKAQPTSKAINLYVTTWFNGSRTLISYASLVYRRFMPGGRGKDINFTGVISTFKPLTDRVYRAYIRPLEPVLRKVNHRGPFHIHLSIEGQKSAVKGISAAFSHPLSLLLFENTTRTTSDSLLRLLDPSAKPIRPLEDWAAGVLISVPPYPYQAHVDDIPLRGIQPSNLKHLWLVDVKRMDQQWHCAGSHGKLGYVTSRGKTLQEAVRRVYRTIYNLEVRDLQFRNDIGKDIHGLLRRLHEDEWIAYGSLKSELARK
jgi:phosphoribosylamine-glycine ligase